MTKTKSIRQRGALLATVSAVALSIACGGQANASDHYVPGAAPAASDVWMAVEGRFNTFTDSSSVFGGYGGEDFAEINADPDDGWSGGLELGVRPVGSQWDYVGRLILGTAEGYDGNYNVEVEETGLEAEEKHMIADFEVGRNMDIGLGDTRVHAGVRFVNFDVSGNGFGYGDGGYNDHYANQKITAIGPRIGIDQKIPVANNLSVDLSAAGAVLYGKRVSDIFVEYGVEAGGLLDGGYYGDSDSNNVTVWNAEASAGLTYLFGPAEATLGYRVDAFMDLYDGENFGGGDRITHGPFAKVKVNFSDDN